MAATLHTSDTVIASLCREVDGIRQRCRLLVSDLSRCQDSALLERLRRERQVLQGRSREVLQLARDWQRQGVQDPLGLAFLIELSQRCLLA